MATTLGFGHIPSPHGGRGIIMAYGTVRDIVDGGSFSVQLQRAGSAVLRNVLAPQITVIDEVYGSQVTAKASGSSNGYIAVKLWSVGTPIGFATHFGTVNLSFVAYGGGGSI